MKKCGNYFRFTYANGYGIDYYKQINTCKLGVNCKYNLEGRCMNYHSNKHKILCFQYKSCKKKYCNYSHFHERLTIKDDFIHERPR